MMPIPFTAQTVAEALADILEQAVLERGFATLAIPGGRSPGPALEHLARIIDESVRAQLHLFWVDERAVPVGDADRNDTPTLAAWQAGGALPGFVHAMPGKRTIWRRPRHAMRIPCRSTVLAIL